MESTAATVVADVKVVMKLKRVKTFLIIFIIIIQTNKMSIGVPIKLLHEAELHVVTVELKTGELYRGYLMEAEDTMNMRLDDVFVTKRDGNQLHFD